MARKKSNVISLLEGEGKKDDFMNLLRQMRGLVDNLPEVVEIHSILAKVRKLKYDALRAEGFTKSEALVIVSKGDVF